MVTEDPKPFYMSKTFWVAAATILAPLAPPVSGFIAMHPEAVLAIVGLVNMGVRALTKKPIKLSPLGK